MKQSSHTVFRTLLYVGVTALALLCVGSSLRYLVSRKTWPSKVVYSQERLKDLKNIIPVAVIGSGPAGSAAALYTARGKVLTVLFEGVQPGGQLTQTTWVENWPGIAKKMGPDIMKEAREQAISYGALSSARTIKSIDVSSWPYVLTDDQATEYNALTVIIASGAKPKLLGVQGEQAYWGKGVTSCAVCDAPFFAGKRVFVVGGGDSAFEEALQLAPYAQHITLLVRGDKARASAAMQDRVKAYPHIAVEYNVSIARIEGDGATVTSVDLNRKGATERQVPIDGVFLAIGHTPNTDFLPLAIHRDQQGYIELQHRQETNVSGIYAAGDVSDHVYRQAGVAAGDGIKAGLDALEFLREINFNEVLVQQLSASLYSPQTARELQPLEEVLDVAQFKKVLASSDMPVLVDVFTDFCAPCKQLMPIVTRFADEHSDQIKVYKVNALKQAAFADEYRVTTVPTLLLFKGGKLVSRQSGALSAQALKDFIFGASK